MALPYNLRDDVLAEVAHVMENFEYLEAKTGAPGDNTKSLKYQGAWSNATAYSPNDAVSYNGSKWIALAVSTNSAPVEGVDWAILGIGPLADGSITNAKIAAGVDAAKIGGGAVSNAEFAYLDGVTSALQTQLNAKEPTVGAGTAGQYRRGDKTWQTLNAAAVAGLGGAATLNVGATAGTVAAGDALAAETTRATAAEGVNATAVAAKISTTARGAANGVAELGADLLLKPSQINVFGRIRDGSEFWVSQNFSVVPLGSITGTGASINVFNPLGGRIAGETNTGTTATGAAAIVYVGISGTLTARGRVTLAMFSEFEVGGFFWVPTLSSGAETFQMLGGLLGVHSPNVMPVDLVAFRSEGDGSGVRCVCASAGVETVSSVTAVVVNTWIKWRIRVVGSNALFYLGDVLVATLTTNLPVSTQPLACEVGIIKSAGTNTRAAYWANIWAWGKYV